MRIGGLASGMDTEQMIKDLMKVERMPLDRLMQNKTWVNWQRDAYRDLNLKLTNFRNTHEKLRLQGSFNTNQVVSSQSNALTATAAGSATPGTYRIEVTQLAEAAKLTSSEFKVGEERAKSMNKVFDAMASASPSTFVIQDQEITITADTTFGTLAKEIAEKTGLKASFDDATGRLFISSKGTGSSQEFTITDTSGTFVKDFITGQPSTTIKGQDAKFTLDGTEFTNSSNTVSVNGLNLTLIDTTTGTATLTIKAEPDKVIEDIKNFVNAYNELILELNSSLTERKNRNYQPLLDEQRRELSDKEAELWDQKAKSGILYNDSLVRSLLSDLRLNLMSPVKGIADGELNMLSQIGITTSKDWKDNGKLILDEEKLRKALLEKPDEVRNLFTRQPSPDEVRAIELDSNLSEAAKKRAIFEHRGLGFQIQQTLNSAIKSLTDKAGVPGSTAEVDETVFGKNIRGLNDKIRRFEDRLKMIESRYWRQFTAMEKAMSQANAQMGSLMNMFGGGMGGY